MLFVLFCTIIFLWSALEASFWWIAPDISISIAYIYFPQYWKRFVVIALAGALIGSVITYFWAANSADSWLAYVIGLHFHSLQNVQYVDHSMVTADLFSVIKGAWGGIPYKLFIGIAAIHDIPFTKIASFGLISRSIRFLFVLSVTVLIRHFSKPWSEQHRAQFAVVLLLIWAIAIAAFDLVVNKAFL